MAADFNDNRKIIIHGDNTSDLRLNKYISESGFCSRREADKLIETGRVSVNGKAAVMGTRVRSSDIVKIDDKLVRPKDDFVYIAFNKPVGVTCTTDRKDPDNIIDFIRFSRRIFPVGRLDKDSQGLILLTSDGDIVNKILRAGNNHEKEYIVKVDKKLTPSFIDGMSNGVKILGTTTKPCRVTREGSNTFRIILTQGLNRQIRRMCAVFGYNVVSLKRIRIMNITIDNIPEGTWRYLSNEEMRILNDLIHNSIKTEEASYL